MKGIDISSYQKVSNWEKVKQEGIEFCIVKVIRKSGDADKSFESHYAGCREQAIAIGGYNYSYADSEAKAAAEAERVLQVLGGRPLPMGVWLDIEEDCQKNLGMILINMIKAYQAVIEKAGYPFGVYTGLSFYNSFIRPYVKELKCRFWIARYPSMKEMKLVDMPAEDKKPVMESDLWGWQYSSNGLINGIEGKTDLNICYGLNQQEHVILPSVREYSAKSDGDIVISKDFRISEFQCRDGTDKILVDVPFVQEKLQQIRNYFQSPVIIMSAYRTETWNKKQGGQPNSYHLKGQAFDIIVRGKTPSEVAKYAQTLGVNGIIEYNSFVHLDSRSIRYLAKANEKRTPE